MTQTLFGGAQRVLFVHAHPDDESIWTGGAIATLNASGASAAVLTLTRGELGEISNPALKALQGTARLAAHRVAELERALIHLGVTEHAILGEGEARAHDLPTRVYEDSGMTWAPDGTATAAKTTGENALVRASVAEALADLINFALVFGADALVSYDETGGYGHPDHVFAHQLTRAAAVGLDVPFWCVLPEGSDATQAQVSRETERYDISELLPAKLTAMAEHASQLDVVGSEFVLSGGQRHEVSGAESYTRVGH